ncbi:hypothetical protein [Paenibacillus daejeonensis]|uniref:hypothetical protein n=1 Tax=Paenibacillus daejeonensis TaxID=135193 RepID=UPI000380BF10|nr:hypothetical protein [Paenibacillus daejeonensis]
MDQNPYQSPDQRSPSGPFQPYSEHDQGEPYPTKQSGLGIASFVIGLLSILGIIGVVVLSMTAAYSIFESLPTDGSVPDPETIAQASGSGVMLLGILLLFTVLLSVVGLILGIIGLFIKNRRKVFGIIGVVLNGVIVFGFGGLLILGTFVQGM